MQKIWKTRYIYGVEEMVLGIYGRSDLKNLVSKQVTLVTASLFCQSHFQIPEEILISWQNGTQGYLMSAKSGSVEEVVGGHQPGPEQ